jgi:hypothetical protein
MPKTGAYPLASTLTGDEEIVVKQGTATRRAAVRDVAELQSTTNVRTFGALGEGNDYTAEVQAALDSLPEGSATTGGSRLYFPPGRYVLSESWLIKNSRVSIEGAGEDATIISASNDFPTDTGIFKLDPTPDVASPEFRFSFSRMRIEGATRAHGVAMVNAATMTFEKVVFVNSRYGIYNVNSEAPPSAAEKVGGLFIHNCRFATSLAGVLMRWGTQVWLEGCWFVSGTSDYHVILDKTDKSRLIGCEFNSWGTAAVFLTSDDANFPCRDIQVIGCDFLDTGAAIIESGQCDWNMFGPNIMRFGSTITVVGANTRTINNIGASPDDTVESASTSKAGLVELATKAETYAGTDSVRAVTPSALPIRGSTGVPVDDDQVGTLLTLPAGIAGLLIVRGGASLRVSIFSVDTLTTNEIVTVFLGANSLNGGLGTPNAGDGTDGNAIYYIGADNIVRVSNRLGATATFEAVLIKLTQ